MFWEFQQQVQHLLSPPIPFFSWTFVFSGVTLQKKSLFIFIITCYMCSAAPIRCLSESVLILCHNIKVLECAKLFFLKQKSITQALFSFSLQVFSIELRLQWWIWQQSSRWRGQNVSAREPLMHYFISFLSVWKAHFVSARSPFPAVSGSAYQHLFCVWIPPTPGKCFILYLKGEQSLLYLAEPCCWPVIKSIVTVRQNSSDGEQSVRISTEFWYHCD